MDHELQLAIKNAAVVLKSAGAKDVFILGSAAKGTLGENSDIDFAVTGLPPEIFFRAMGEATRVLGRTLDLIDLDEETPFTTFLKEGTELLRVA